MDRGSVRLSVGAVTAEALRFAGRHLEDALRLCWAPTLGLLAWQAWGAAPAGDYLTGLTSDAGSAPFVRTGLTALVPLVAGLVSLVLTASYMAPLVAQAGADVPPSHRTIPNRLGGPELRWMLGSVLSLSGLFLLAKAPVTAGLSALRRLAEHAWSAQSATFEAGSLHASDLVPTYSEGLRDFLGGGYVGLPNGIGITTGAPGIVQAVGLVLFAYVWLRLFPLAAILTVGGGGRGVVRATLAASAGWNLARLLGIVTLVALANVALVWILGWVPTLLSTALYTAYPFLAGISAFGSGGVIEPWVEDSLTRLSQGVEIVFLLLVTAFGAAVNAGALGAIARRVRA